MFNATPVLLLIVDGFGYRDCDLYNAISQANTPNLDALYSKYAHGFIKASGIEVGLPYGQFGNSEVGHLNIGAGRVILQDITRIDLDIAQNKFELNPVIQNLIKQTNLHNRTLHLIGLLSDGGVHSHEKHFHALIQAAHTSGSPRVRIHAFLDGRDTPPRSAKTYLQNLEVICKQLPDTKIASICGRYWSMDRDNRFDRIEKTYRMLVESKAKYHATDALSALKTAYQRGENDEFVQPTIVASESNIKDNDSVMFMNFRADRARELTTALTDKNFNIFQNKPPKLSMFISMTNYGENYNHPVAYPPQIIRNGLGEYLSKLGLKQLRIAETEKYPHVTYFFNGGEEKKYPGEKRIMIPSPKVATYDLQPEMSAKQVTDKVIAAIDSQEFDVIICNLANADMVGHTGIFDAAIQAVETIDECIGKCINSIIKSGGEAIITADHGNCEQMYDATNKQAHTQHTLNKVPFLYVGRPATIYSGGALKDISPSLLSIMDIEKPDEMTGNSLIRWL